MDIRPGLDQDIPMLKRAAVLLYLTSAAIAAAQSLPPELFMTRSGDVAAHFGGQRIADGAGDLRYVATAIWFTFEGDPKTYAVNVGEQDTFRNWDFNFDIFSPDGQHVLLLRDDFGPYHVVAVKHLKEYLKNGGKPDFEVSGLLPGEANAGVHHGAHWTSASTIEFSFSCCATERLMHFDMEKGAVSCARQRETDDISTGPWRDCT
jgi:hypothetical protein